MALRVLKITDFPHTELCEFKLYPSKTRAELHQKVFSIPYQEHTGLI